MSAQSYTDQIVCLNNTGPNPNATIWCQHSFVLKSDSRNKAGLEIFIKGMRNTFGKLFPPNLLPPHSSFISQCCTYDGIWSLFLFSPLHISLIPSLTLSLFSLVHPVFSYLYPISILLNTIDRMSFSLLFYLDFFFLCLLSFYIFLFSASHKVDAISLSLSLIFVDKLYSLLLPWILLNSLTGNILNFDANPVLQSDFQPR